MRIEKINDHQIRCTLNQKDLSDRELRISELAYGSEKAKALFRDMMQQASYEFGFEAEDIPLMVEANPKYPDSLELVITKVDDPEELDTRFARFAPSVTEESEDEDDSYTDMDENEISDLFHQIQTEKQSFAPSDRESDSAEKEESNRSRLFLLSSLGSVMTVSQVVAPNYSGFSTLYKDGAKGTYLLLLTQGNDTREDFEVP